MGTKYTTARISICGEKFEIVVHPEKALNFKLGKPCDISSVILTETIYSDVNKGMRASSEKLKKCFGTTDPLRIAEIILKKGELQLTAEQRKRLIEDKRKQIIAFISKHCYDPQTKLPHPPTRIEQAMSQIHYPIDPFKDAEAQAKEVIDLLKPILPIKMETVKLELIIPAAHIMKVYGLLREYGSITNESWLPDGSWRGTLNIPAGVQADLLDKLGKLTQGSAQAKILR